MRHTKTQKNINVPIYSEELPIQDTIKSIWGNSSEILSSKSMSGGCIGDVHKIKLSTGETIIYKTYGPDNRKDTSPEHRCMTEVLGLLHIADTHTITVPQLHAVQGCSMLLSYYPFSHPQKGFWETFAQALSKLHTTPLPLYDAKIYFGFAPSQYEIHINSHPHYTHEPLGNMHQPYHSWIEFFTQERIWKQCQRAERNGYFNTSVMQKAEKLCQRLPHLLSEPTQASLLHGDLWGGNYICSDNTPILIDPAVHIGHYESEIALTQLFGGFAQEFYHAYSKILPLDKSFFRERTHLYNLYHVINHLNLFGHSYYQHAVSIIQKFC